jgi:hypothetical protein
MKFGKRAASARNAGRAPTRAGRAAPAGHRLPPVRLSPVPRGHGQIAQRHAAEKACRPLARRSGLWSTRQVATGSKKVMLCSFRFYCLSAARRTRTAFLREGKRAVYVSHDPGRWSKEYRRDVRVSLEPLALGHADDDRAEGADALLRQVLRRDVLLEGKRVDARVLTRKAVRRQGLEESRYIGSSATEGGRTRGDKEPGRGQTWLVPDA